jgi:predicted nucleic acid-binding protein
LSVAYVDSSVLVGHAFGERSASTVVRRLRSYARVVSSPLLEAELLAALRREGRELDERWLDGISLVPTDRSLRAEIDIVLGAGYLRGADCWHLATALYVAAEPASLAFLTLDTRQAAVAAKLGFAT